jgi:hypothetical protein
MGSYGLAVQLADEWEQELRDRKQRTPRKKVVSTYVEYRINEQAMRAGAELEGLWNYKDVANKACQLLRERLGE